MSQVRGRRGRSDQIGANMRLKSDARFHALSPARMSRLKHGIGSGRGGFDRGRSMSFRETGQIGRLNPDLVALVVKDDR